MDIEKVFFEVVEMLHNLGIPYFITGALAVSYYGEPRSTHDIDIVLEMNVDTVKKVTHAFGEKFFVDEQSVKLAIQKKSFFQMVHKETLLKVDCWILKDDEFSLERFRRRKEVEISGKKVYFPTPEDLIITKLEWFKKSGIDKHYLDAISVLKVQGEKIDAGYIERWCMQKSIIKIWEKIKLKNKRG